MKAVAILVWSAGCIKIFLPSSLLDVNKCVKSPKQLVIYHNLHVNYPANNVILMIAQNDINPLSTIFSYLHGPVSVGCISLLHLNLHVFFFWGSGIVHLLHIPPSPQTQSCTTPTKQMNVSNSAKWTHSAIQPYSIFKRIIDKCHIHFHVSVDVRIRTFSILGSFLSW